MRRFRRSVGLLIPLAILWLYSSGKAQSDDTYINFSFDAVDVRTFVKLVGDISKRKFVIDENVKGKITVLSPRVNLRDVYPLFLKILESVGCGVIEEGPINRVVLLPDRPVPLAPVVGSGETTPNTGFVTKIIRLEHVSAGQVKKALDPQGTGSSIRPGRMAAIEETNHLILTDTAENIRAVEKILAEIDRPGMVRTTEVIQLRFASAEDLAEELNRALQSSPSSAERLRNRLPAVAGATGESDRGPFVIASAHGNTLILVGSAADVTDLKAIIGKMDVDAPSGRGGLNAIFLKYLASEDAAKQLNALFGRVPMAGERKEGGAAATAVADLSKRIAIEPSPANNALLVNASPGDFEVVRRLVEQLDMPPEQVQISVLIAEVSAGDALNLGVEMASVDLPGRTGDMTVQGGMRMSDATESLMTEIQKGIFPRGLTVGVAQGTRLDASGKVVAGYPGVLNIDAIRKDSRFDILSETALEAQNNLEASLSIVNEIPILKSTIQGGTGTSRDVIQNIERVGVGIKLKLTPHVIPPGDQIRMVLNPVIEAVVDPGPEGTQFAPTIARREVSTTVTVPTGQMIVIAGLTRQDKMRQTRRVPILGSIPIIGWLFRSHSQSEEKTNVLIFVTPRLVTAAAAAEAARAAWTNKTGLVVSP